MRAAYTQALLDRAQAYVGQPLNRRRYEDGLAEISQLYADITGEAVGTCRQCQYLDYLAVVTAYIREATRSLHPELMADSKYTFAPGFENEAIADGRYRKVVKADNLTDEDAEYLLKLGYEHVIVLKPGQEPLLAGASEQNEGGDKEPERTEREKALEVQLTQQFASYEELLGKYSKAESDRQGLVKGLEAEKKAHTTTKAQLTKAQNELSRKTTVPPTPATPTEPVMTASSTPSSAPDGPAEVAPAPPAAPADGTAAN